jgi:hypothetical protein
MSAPEAEEEVAVAAQKLFQLNMSLMDLKKKMK